VPWRSGRAPRDSLLLPLLLSFLPTVRPAVKNIMARKRNAH